MIIDNLNKHHLILASGSIRRQQLLTDLGLKFEIVTKDYTETYPEGLIGEEIARHISREKAHTFKGGISDNDIVITADTIVWCKDHVLGKPVNYSDAVRILEEISGNTHEVITGVTIFSSSKEVTFSETTRVTFDTISAEDISFYVDIFKPYDKAGAYGIQEWIGLTACSRIEGSYFNVVGLPVQRVYRELRMFTRSDR